MLGDTQTTKVATPVLRTEEDLAREDLARLATSERIRYRLISAGCRYHANDNIAAFIADGELEALQAEVETAIDCAVGFARSSPFPDPAGIELYVYPAEVA